MPSVFETGDIEAKFTLQKWVGWVSATVTFSFAILSFVAWAQGGDLFVPMVVMLVFTVLFGLTAVRESKTAQMLQTVTYLLSGYLIFADSAAPSPGGYLFVVFAVFLYNEYADSPRRVPVMVVIGVATISIDIGLRLPTLRFLSLQAIQTTIFVAAVLFLFNFLSYRQVAIRRLHVTELESRIADRTKELEIQSTELAAAVRDRNVLIQELHHRIGNSLQVLSSYIRLTRDGDSVSSDEVLDATLLRIQAISQVYGMLHSAGDLEEVSLQDYVENVVNDILQVYGDRLFVTTRVDAAGHCGIDFVVPLGLVLQELLGNAAKHAGSGRKTAMAYIDVTTNDGQLAVRVSDDGPGFSDTWERTISTDITDELVQQIGGTIERSNDGGAQVVCRFTWPPGEQIA
jgi:two-component sensor histidine kinase